MKMENITLEYIHLKIKNYLGLILIENIQNV